MFLSTVTYFLQFQYFNVINDNSYYFRSCSNFFNIKNDYLVLLISTLHLIILLKFRLECYEYLFELACEMHSFGIPFVKSISI